MNRTIQDIFDSFSDETIDIKPVGSISEDKVIELTKRKIKEDTMNLSKHKKKLSIPVVAAAMAAVLSISIFAAHHFLSPKEVATQLKDSKLAEYFSADDTKFDFEPQVSGGYTFQLLGVAAGKNLSSFTEVEEDKSYIVGAIAKADGTPLTEYPDIMVTPLVAGFKPWQVNAFTLCGGRQNFLYEGVDYFVFQCDNIEIFADHTIYIAAYEGMAPGADEFTMEADGNIRFNDSYTGAKAMFTLPIDASKANPEAVKALLEDIGGSEDGAIAEAPGEDKANTTLVFDDEDGTGVVEVMSEEFEVTADKTEEGMAIEIRDKQ